MEERERGLLANEQGSKRVGEGQLGAVDGAVRTVKVHLGDSAARSCEGDNQMMEGGCIGNRCKVRNRRAAGRVYEVERVAALKHQHPRIASVVATVEEGLVRGEGGTTLEDQLNAECAGPKACSCSVGHAGKGGCAVETDCSVTAVTRETTGLAVDESCCGGRVESRYLINKLATGLVHPPVGFGRISDDRVMVALRRLQQEDSRRVLQQVAVRRTGLKKIAVSHDRGLLADSRLTYQLRDD